MMINLVARRLLAQRVTQSLKIAPSQLQTQKRKLYTDSIYPYPERYVNTHVYPNLPVYRETCKPAPWRDEENFWAEVLAVFMWSFVWWYALTVPEEMWGEFDIPDPSIWSDEHLGIPPDDAEV